MTNSRILVIGHENYVGRQVRQTLEASAWATPVVAELRKLPALHEFDAVINCTTGAPRQILTVAHTLFDAASTSPVPPRIVHLSSMTVYGAATGSVEESAEPVGELSPYAAAHVTAERRARLFARSVILRPGCEYGPGCPQWSERVARWLRPGRLGDLGAAGDGVCNLLYIDDLVAAILSATGKSALEGRVYNLAMRDAPTWNEYFTQFAIELGAVPVRRITRRRLAFETRCAAVPLKLLEIAARGVGSSADKLPPAIPPSLLRACAQEIRLDVSRAERDLGMKWTPLQAGLRGAARALEGVPRAVGQRV